MCLHLELQCEAACVFGVAGKGIRDNGDIKLSVDIHGGERISPHCDNEPRSIEGCVSYGALQSGIAPRRDSARKITSVDTLVERVQGDTADSLFRSIILVT